MRFIKIKDIKNIENYLKRIDYWRDRLLFPFIIRFWPRFITPNQLSVLKIFLGLVLGSLLFMGWGNKLWLVSLFCLAIILDLFDGSVARALNKKTRLGAFIDPVGDKTLILPVAFFSLTKFYYQWLLFFLILPEVISSVGSWWCHKKKQPIESNIFGKTKMVLESFAFGFILLNWPNQPNYFILICLWLAGFLAIVSLFVKWLGYQNN